MLSQSPVTLGNGLIRCYNMFPSYFKNIDEMTAYLPELKKRGLNVVWINPVQLAGQTIIEKADPITGQNQDIKGSLYAMADMTLIDPRFSVVARDEDGDMDLSPEQIQIMEKQGFKVDEIYLRSKELRQEITSTQNEIDKREKAINKNLNNLKKYEEDKSSEQYQRITQDIQNIENKLVPFQKTLKILRSAFTQIQQMQINCIQLLDGKAMRNFTHTAKQLGITPIFDLVFNHLANDTALVKEQPELFNFEDKTFPDATAFTYSKLLGSRRNTEPLSQSDRTAIVHQIPTIIEQIWRPFILQYVRNWGFCGVRVDCVKKVPKELRAQVYDLIRTEVSKQKEPMPVVILEETLFSDLSPEEFVSKVGNAGATHNIGSNYYKQRLWHGGLPEDHSFEDFYKKSMVAYGVINFSGNHDHYSCAMTVCRELAMERLQKNKELFEIYKKCLAEKEDLSDGAQELLKAFFLHHYVKEIIAELHNPDYFNDQINRFGVNFRDKFLTSVFCGSGGYFMMSGDEFASFRTPSVFMRANGEALHPNNQLAIFSKHKEICDKVICKMAQQIILGRKYKDIYLNLNEMNKDIFLSPIKEQLRNEINANVIVTKERFVKQVKAALKEKEIDWSEEFLENIEIENSFHNSWQAPQALEAFTPSEFYSHVNTILATLPAAKTHFWSELFKAMDGDILIAVRVNGYGYAADTDVVIYNLNPHKTIPFSLQDLEKISQWLQQRGFPDVNETVRANPDYHRAKGCIMGSSAYHQRPANLYFGGYFKLDKDIKDYRKKVNGSAQGFNICVQPQVRKDPLSLEMPEEFFAEKASDVLLPMFHRLRLSVPSNTSSVQEKSSPTTEIQFHGW